MRPKESVFPFNAMKNELRKKCSDLRAQISNKSFKDEMICKSVLKSEFYRESKEILCFYPIKSEINTCKIISAAFTDNKKLYLPVCLPEKGLMRFYLVNSFDDLKVGKFAIPEPDISSCNFADSFNDAICVVPALAYDYLGFRLGYGGGYYDRFLADFNFPKVGICYEEMLFERLPADNYDVNVDYIITEKRLIKASKEV